MNSVGVQTDPLPVQQPDQTQSTARTKHWSRSRVVHVVAGIAVIGLGALAGFALSFFASTFTAVVLAGAVSVILGGAVYGYLRYKIETSPAYPAPQNANPPSPDPASQGATPPLPVVSASIPAVSNRLKKFFTSQEQRAQEMLSPHGFRLYASSRDGNCFYDAIAHQCPTAVKDAEDLRKRVAEFAEDWKQRHPLVDPRFTAIEGRAYARLGNDVAYSQVHSGLDEIGTPGCYADQVDAYFVAQVLARPVIIINIKGEVTLAVNENGKQIGCRKLSSLLIPENSIVVIHDQSHFLGVDPK